MQKIQFKPLLILMLLFVSSYAFTQGVPPPPSKPIDGGLAILAAIGAAYGIKKLRRRD